MNRPRPVLTTYELEQMAIIFNRICCADKKDIDYTEYYIRDCWPGSDPNWVTSFFTKLVEHAPKLNH